MQNKQIGFNLFDEPVKKELSEFDLKVKKTNCQLIIWAYEYYNIDQPSVTDFEYDGMYQTYREMIKETNYRPFCDMLTNVGAPKLMAYHAALRGIRGKLW